MFLKDGIGLKENNGSVHRIWTSGVQGGGGGLEKGLSQTDSRHKTPNKCQSLGFIREKSVAPLQPPAHHPHQNYYLKRMSEDYRRTLRRLQLGSTFIYLFSFLNLLLLTLSVWLGIMKTYWPLLELPCTADWFETRKDSWKIICIQAYKWQCEVSGLIQG